MIRPESEIQEDWTVFLRRVFIFSDLEEDAVKEVAKKLKPLYLPAGSTLFHEGDRGEALYIVQSGKLRVTTSDEFGKEKVLNHLGRGDILGETSLLTGTVHSATIKVDTNAHLLVLYKTDFEDFLKQNPTAALYLSRLLSHRLDIASHPTLLTEQIAKFHGFFCDLPKDDHIVFMVNLGLSLTEQTRRKVLLLELSPYGAELVHSMKLTPILTSSKMLKSGDLHNPKILEKFTLIHPSGLEIMTLSEDTFSGILFRSIPLFIATLRKLYDYVIIDMAGMKEHSVLSDKHGNEVVHAFLQESNSVYYVCSQEPTQTQFLNVLTQEHEAVTKIVLGEKSSSIYFPVDFTLPWNDQIISHFKREASPYLTGPRSEWTYRAMNRLARFIAKMQVGIAMGSGAAYGYTLIGMLKVFEREKIPLDFISGTSMGALIGSFYASGKSAEELTEIAHAISKVWIRHNALNDLNLPWPHGGFLKGTTISRFLKSVLGEKQFSDLQIPFACVATDIMTGDQVILREGKVWEAVRASLSLPIVFCPYKLGNRFLVDGGLVNPVPTSVIALMGADILISVNLTSRVSEKKVTSRLLGMFPASSPGMSNILFKMIYTMQYKIASSKTDLSHIVITPDTRNFVWTDFHKAKQIIPLGEEAAEENLTKIKSRLPFFADYCRVNLRRRY